MLGGLPQFYLSRGHSKLQATGRLCHVAGQWTHIHEHTCLEMEQNMRWNRVNVLVKDFYCEGMMT